MLFLYCISEYKLVWGAGAGINPEPVFTWVIHCNRTQDCHNILVQILYACRCKLDKYYTNTNYSYFLFFHLFYLRVCSLNLQIVLVGSCNSYFKPHGGGISLKSSWPANRKKKTWTEKPVYLVFTPLSPSVRCGDFAILLILGWRRPPPTSHGIWLADGHTRIHRHQWKYRKVWAAANQSAGGMCHSVAALRKENQHSRTSRHS